MIRANHLGRRSRGSFILSFIVFVCCLFVSYKMYAVIYEYLSHEDTFPVSRVVIKGDLKYITKAEIADVVGKMAGGRNIVSLDLAQVHNALVQMPWVASVSVQKRMPDTLIVALQEHFPAARWKNTGLYDYALDTVFYPDMRKFQAPLVTLSAPHDTLAKELYEHAALFLEVMAQSPYHLEEVQLDAARGYRVRIEGDVWLILGRESSEGLPLLRLKRFLVAFKHTNLKLSDISYVDLRYDNGFAVGERKHQPVLEEK